MSNINFNFNSGKDDFTSLKEAIFKRAREKAEALNNEVKDSYTSDVKADIMESARISVRNNPFINLIDTEEKDVQGSIISKEQSAKPEILHSKNVDYTRKGKGRRFPSRINNELYTAAVREGTMREASATIRQNQNVMNSLKFLNTQAAIALNKRFINAEIEQPPKEITFGI